MGYVRSALLALAGQEDKARATMQRYLANDYAPIRTISKWHARRSGNRYRPLALQLQFLPEMSFARIGLMGSAPRRPCEDIGVRDAPLGKLRGDTADFLDRPADQERRFGRDRSFVFLSDRPVLAR